MTPETKWGYDFVNGADEKPEQSWLWIVDQIRQHYPSAGDKQIQKVLGIRR